MSHRTIRRSWAILGSYFLLTLLLTWPLARHMGDAIPGDSFDGWQNFWNLWWIKVALLEQRTSPYFTNLLYHPTGVSLWFQTLNIFNGATFLPVQLTGNLFWAYNVIVLFSFTAAGFGGYLLGLKALRQVGIRPGPGLRWGAFLSGLIFTFSPFHFAHLLGHMQVFSLEFIPFFALYLLRTLDSAPPGQGAKPNNERVKSRWRNALLATLFLILAALCDWYFALYLGFFALVALLWLLMQRRLSWRDLMTTAIIFGLALLATAPLLSPMVSESLHYDFMKPPPGQIVQLSGDVFGFFIPSGMHSLWGDWAAQLRTPLNASPAENTIYLGVVALMLAIIGIWRWRGHLGLWILTAILFGIFALGPVLHFYGSVTNIPLPYVWILKLPFVSIARTVARYDLLVMLAVGVLAGAGLAALMDALSRRRRLQIDAKNLLSSMTIRVPALAAAGIVALVLLDFAPVPYPISPPDTPDFYRTLATDERTAGVLNLPMGWDRPGYLLYQTTHKKPLTAGYISRTDPRTLPARVPVINRFRLLAQDINCVDAPARLAPTIFEFMDIRWVILDRYKMPPGFERDFDEALTRDIFGDIQPIYEDDRLTVYETTPPTMRYPFVEIGWDFGPLEDGPARAVNEKATVTFHIPQPGTYQLIVTPVTNNLAPWRLINLEANEPALEGLNEPEMLITQLSGPTTTFELLALEPGLKIHHLEIKPYPYP